MSHSGGLLQRQNMKIIVHIQRCARPRLKLKIYFQVSRFLQINSDAEGHRKKCKLKCLTPSFGLKAKKTSFIIRFLYLTLTQLA
jgi:hypothetical protein